MELDKLKSLLYNSPGGLIWIDSIDLHNLIKIAEKAKDFFDATKGNNLGNYGEERKSYLSDALEELGK